VRTLSEPDLETTLPRSFYERPVERVARALLGSLLVRTDGSDIVGGRIVETEAYGGPGDPGSHADRAPNGRARIMFGPAGIAYVYFTYGMHHCMNAVTGANGRASAVLIRAFEPLFGVERMREGAPSALPGVKVASGPGRVCRALGIDRTFNGTDLTHGPVRILEGPRQRRIETGTRIGLTTDDGRAWRYWTGSPSVSYSRRPRTTA
jgi:DNA-3-methyladenine glycosylase